MQMCQGKGQQRRKYQRAAREGRGDPAECQGPKRTSCFPGRKAGSLRNYSYLHLQEPVPDTQMWDGWAQRSDVSTGGFFKDGNSRGPSIQVTQGRRVIVLHALWLTHIQRDLKLLCQFGSSLPLTHNPATRSFLSKGLSVHPTSSIKQKLRSQIIPPDLSVHAVLRSGCLCSLCSQWSKR